MLLGVLGVVAIYLVLSDKPSFTLSNTPQTLAIRLRGAMPDGPGEGEFNLDPEKYTVYQGDYAFGIRAAAQDPSISALQIHIDGPQIGMAGAQEIRQAIQAFAATGKPCVAWSKSYDNLDYYLATGCNQVHMHPQGSTMVLGLRVQTQHFAGTLEKLGVEPQFLRIGDYKSAPESFTSTAPSAPTQEMMLSMLDSLHGQFVEEIAAARNLEEDAFQALIDDPPVTAKQALEAGLVDALESPVDLDESVGIRMYLNSLADQRKSGPQIGVLHVQGTIVDGNSSGDAFGGTSSGDKDIVAHLEQLRDDDEIAAIVMRVNSPGGSAMASDLIWQAVVEADAIKPVVISMGRSAASGGYYISAPARRIFAQPATLTGSIGIFAGKMSLAGLYEKIGVSTWSANRGELAGIYDPQRPFSDLEQEKLQEVLREFYDTFIDKVAQGRDLSIEEVDGLGQGRVWTGAQAVENGLADELGGLSDAIDAAEALAGLPEGAYDLVVLPAPATLFEALMEGLNPDIDAQALLLSVLREEDGGAAGEMLRLAPVLEQNGLAAALPFRIQVQ